MSNLCTLKKAHSNSFKVPGQMRYNRFMKLIVKHFSELSAAELFEIYKLRVSVFVVEQKCPYQEVDDADKNAFHLWLEEEDKIEERKFENETEVSENGSRENSEEKESERGTEIDCGKKRENGKILAYSRVLPKGVLFDEVSVGRVIAAKRRSGLGTKIVSEAVRVAKEKFSPDKIILEAQVYARKFYENLGFRKISDEFLEDGIPHIFMQLNLNSGR